MNQQAWAEATSPPARFVFTTYRPGPFAVPPEGLYGASPASSTSLVSRATAPRCTATYFIMLCGRHCEFNDPPRAGAIGRAAAELDWNGYGKWRASPALPAPRRTTMRHGRRPATSKAPANQIREGKHAAKLPACYAPDSRYARFQ